MSATAAPKGLGWPLYDAAAIRTQESAAQQTSAPHALMQRAGLSVARLALAVAPHARRVWIAAGSGNNGGDGLEAALHLARAGREITVSIEPRATRPADAQAALNRAQAAGLTLRPDATAPDLQAGDLALDALFGLGLSRAATGWALEAIRSLNAMHAPVLAIDLPSGLDGDHGVVHAERSCVRAQWTLSLLALKPGLFTAAGRDQAGEIWFDGLGVKSPRDPPVAHLLTDTGLLWPTRHHAQHKGSFGDVWVIGGASGMTGASMLAARAALIAGAGRVHWLPLDPQAPVVDILHPELMVHPAKRLQAESDGLETATVVCGCGGGEAVRALLPLLVSRAGRLVLDADALNALACDAAALAPLLAARAARGRPTVLTPHPLEAARLLGCSTPAVQADRLAAARRIAERHGAIVVLKGSGSVIAAPNQTPWINASGNAALASAGTGDVLAGWIGGLWSQGLTPVDAACLGVHTHGAAADRWRATKRHAGALNASELVRELRRLRND
ncbi:MAG: NAD(P)H-hydrate dehydratase [Methylibium sp.]|nr:NAD(P)H-hydrate dehydratase [Methylibium sp.]MBA3598041.1 NAD(P)H-hydrate dehydratase [Methylibium sp.]